MASGSSPLARGKFDPGFSLVSGAGFIPTRAGKMLLDGLTLNARPVHPHSRGENASLLECGVEAEGSSPLARGKSVSGL